MPQIASYEESKSNVKHRTLPGGHQHWRTDFLIPPKGAKDEPVAFLAAATPHRITRPHFHDVDQFQVIVKGDGVLGKHPVARHAVHFTRAHTPYGPIVGGEQGIGFLTLRAQWDQGAQYLPAAREHLTQIPDRRPWQVTEMPKFGVQDTGDACLQAFDYIKDDLGLAAYSVSLKPKAQMTAPDPSTSGGQYIIVTRGSLVYQNKDYNAVSIAFLKPSELAMQLIAGPKGLEALVLHYPRAKPAVNKQPPASRNTHLRIWQCALCAFSYDEAQGMPHEGIAPGTRWEDVPDSWSCPDCAASKGDFEMQVVR